MNFIYSYSGEICVITVAKKPQKRTVQKAWKIILESYQKTIKQLLL